MIFIWRQNLFDNPLWQVIMWLTKKIFWRMGFLVMALAFSSLVTADNSLGTAAKNAGTTGIYPVGWDTETLPRTGGGNFTALVIYPATANGNDTPVDTSGAPYPGIVFGHGFFQNPNRYQPSLEYLASHGYIIVAPETQLGLFPDVEQYVQDFSDSLTWLETANQDPNSQYYQAINPNKLAVSGHSMGGGTTILAAANDSRVVAVLNMAAIETNPSAIEAMSTLTIPVSLLSGSEDAIVPYENNSLLMYNNGNAPRMLPLLLGGSHCGFQDDPFPIFCDTGSMDPATQLQLMRAHTVHFFGLYLQEDQSYWPYLWGPATRNNPDITFTADPGMTLTPKLQSQQGATGQILSYNLTLSNSSQTATSYSLFAAGNSWTTTISPTQTPLIEPGQSATITVQVTVAGNGNNNDLAIISARSDADGLTRQLAYLISRR